MLERNEKLPPTIISGVFSAAEWSIRGPNFPAACAWKIAGK